MIKIYPLSLRAKINHCLKKFIPLSPENVSLEFNSRLRMNLKKSDAMHQFIMYNGYYELTLTEKILEVAKTGGVLFDVGANYGYFSLLWAAEKPGNKVFAFEPSPANFKALQTNANLNNLNSHINCYDILTSSLGHPNLHLK